MSPWMSPSLASRKMRKADFRFHRFSADALTGDASALSDKRQQTRSSMGPGLQSSRLMPRRRFVIITENDDFAGPCLYDCAVKNDGRALTLAPGYWRRSTSYHHTDRAQRSLRHAVCTVVSRGLKHGVPGMQMCWEFEAWKLSIEQSRRKAIRFVGVYPNMPHWRNARSRRCVAKR